MIAAPQHLSAHADLDAFRVGCAALMAFAEVHPESLDLMHVEVKRETAFDYVCRPEMEPGIIMVAFRPSARLLRIVRAFGGTRSVNAILHAFGFDPELRAAA